MQPKKLNQVNHILKRIRWFCLSMFVLCLTLSVCVPVNVVAATTDLSVMDDTDADNVMADIVSDDSTQQETKKSETQTKEQKTIRIGSFEDTFDYVDKNSVRRGFGYELMQALAGYTGWKFEYVTGPTVLISLKVVRLMLWAISLTQMNVQKRCFFRKNRWVRKNIFFMLIYQIWILGCLISSL